MTDPNNVKDEGKANSTTHVNVKVSDQAGSVVHFKIKRHTALKKLMNAYCDRQGVKQSTLRFMFDGNHVQESTTPAELEMEDDDTIEVFLQQTGGTLRL